MRITFLGFENSHALCAGAQEPMQLTSDMLIELSGNNLRVWEQSPTTGLRCLYVASVTPDNTAAVKLASGKRLVSTQSP